MHTLFALLIAALVTAASAADTVDCDTRLERTDGTTTPVITDRARPAVVFYEDRASTGTNQELKDALYARGKAEGLLDDVRIVAVANLKQYDFFPARGIATTFIRGVEATVGIPILLDLRGALATAPWSLPPDGGTVVILDRACRETFRHTGTLGPADTDRFFAALEVAVGRAPRG